MGGRIGVVVVNWNGLADTRVCVASVLASVGAHIQVVVVDNGSEQDEAAVLCSEYPSVTALRLGENRGYGGAANVGIAAVRARGCDYAFLLNNDTKVEPDTVAALERAARDRGPRAIIAPIILRADGRVWSAGGALRWPWVAGTHVGIAEHPASFSEPAVVAWASGCALFASLRCFDDVGDFDERYFLYLEDMDWCLRARRHGYDIWCVPAARIMHGVTKTVNRIDPRIGRYYAYRNFYIAGMRNAPVRWRAWLLGHLLFSLGKALARNAFFPSYRRNSFYNARTRALFDFVLGRRGMAPYEHRLLTSHARAMQKAGT